MFDAFWRAAVYCLHPRLVLWSLLPLLLAGGAVALLGWTYWEPAVAAVRDTLEQWALTAAMLQWLDTVGANQLRTLVGPMIVVALAVPVLVLLSLLLVASLMTPAIVRLVAARRFPELEMRRGASIWQTLGWALACTLAALLALVLSVPLWLVPPLVLVLPPLIWRHRDTLDQARLFRAAMGRNERQALGFYLELTGQLGGDQRLVRRARRLRDRRRVALQPFFAGGRGAFARAAAQEKSPPVARQWGFLMNMELESFAATFRKHVPAAA